MVTQEWGDVVYAPPSARSNDVLRLDSDEAHHLFRVLRAAAGQKIRATDGAGMVYDCTIGEDRTLRIDAERPEQGEPDVHVCLCVATLKAGMDREIVDVATQLGVREIIFFHSVRCEGKLQADKLEKLQRAAITAIKQCCRARLPQVRLENGLKPLLAALTDYPLRLLAHPIEGNPAGRQTVSDPLPSKVAVIVGPEGGFTDQEVEQMLAANCQPLSLGSRRLRSEVAVAAALSYVMVTSREME
jgi:16S rRNA (uracil1498-N3)-methyltransferase